MTSFMLNPRELKAFTTGRLMQYFEHCCNAYHDLIQSDETAFTHIDAGYLLLLASTLKNRGVDLFFMPPAYVKALQKEAA